MPPEGNEKKITPKINKTTTGVLLDSSDKGFVIGLRILVLIKIKAVVKNRKIYPKVEKRY